MGEGLRCCAGHLAEESGALGSGLLLWGCGGWVRLLACWGVGGCCRGLTGLRWLLRCGWALGSGDGALGGGGGSAGLAWHFDGDERFWWWCRCVEVGGKMEVLWMKMAKKANEGRWTGELRQSEVW